MYTTPATWSVISPLTEKSVANKSAPVDFPDFTRGKWMTNPAHRHHRGMISFFQNKGGSILHAPLDFLLFR